MILTKKNSMIHLNSTVRSKPSHSNHFTVLYSAFGHSLHTAQLKFSVVLVKGETGSVKHAAKLDVPAGLELPIISPIVAI